VVVAFDVTNATSFNNVKNWLDSINQHADASIVKALVGNKIDLADQRMVSYEEARLLAEQNKMPYFETSAKLNKNVEELMTHMMESVYNKLLTKDDNGGRDANTIVLKSQKAAQEGSGSSGKEGKKGGCC
jgi:GTPase SAR1 family protein